MEQVQILFDISAFNVKNYLEDARWMFLSTRLRAIVFIISCIFLCITLAIFYIVDPTQKILSQYLYPKRNSIELLSHVNEYKKDSIHVLLLGGSTSRELTGDSKIISEKISNICSKPVNFINAGSSSQSYVAARTLYSEYQKKNVDLVIVGLNYFRLIVNPLKLNANISNNGLLIPTPINLLIEEFGLAQHMPAIEPLYFGAKLRYFIKKSGSENLINTARGEAKKSLEFVALHNYYKKPAKSKQEKQKDVRRFLLSRYPDYSEYSSIGIERWLRFSEYAKSQGSNVLLLSLPQDESMMSVDGYFSPIFDRFLFIAKSRGISVEDWRKNKFQLVSDDYFDQQHLLASGRKKIVQEIVNLIVNHLPEC